MKSERHAVIDVGTNSVKLLVAEVSGSAVTPIEECSEQTRLGRGFYSTHQLQPEPIELTARAVARFAALARQLDARATRVIATSAARDAHNSQELVAAIERTAHLPVEIITGEQEAEWAVRGVTTDPHLSQQTLLVLDVGGGSTQTILYDQAVRLRHSFRLGAVRLFEHLQPKDPPQESALKVCRSKIREYVQAHMRPFLAPAIADGTLARAQLVGTGGTATVLAMMHSGLVAFARDRIEATALSRDQVGRHLRQLWNMPLAQRRTIPGLPPQRADVILTGAAIYEAVMSEFQFADLRVSTRGLRFAAVMDGAVEF